MICICQQEERLPRTGIASSSEDLHFGQGQGLSCRPLRSSPNLHLVRFDHFYLELELHQVLRPVDGASYRAVHPDSCPNQPFLAAVAPVVQHNLVYAVHHIPRDPPHVPRPVVELCMRRGVVPEGGVLISRPRDSSSQTLS